jgi:hypothetical protein
VLALPLRIVVANQLAEEEHNAMLHLFSARRAAGYGRRNYHMHSRDASTSPVRVDAWWGTDKISSCLGH